MVDIVQVSKVYPLYRRPADRLLEALPFLERRLHEDFWALRDVTLQVGPGEALAVVGANGSGKSTLLQIASGILPPSRGRVCVEGRVAALLELGAGFNPEFTGRENVYINAELMGCSRRQIDARFPDIARFAGIGAFIERPVKEYSTGMYIRLAFSTAIHVDPDVLIVDEALSVGDAAFASRSMQKFEELRARGVTLLFVSHDLGLVKKLADRAILLVRGQVAAEGSPEAVVNRYMAQVLEKREEAPREAALEGESRHGDGASVIESVSIADSLGQPAANLMAGRCYTVGVRVRCVRALDNPVVGILIRDRLGIDVYGTNTLVEGVELGAFDPGEAFEVCFDIECALGRGEYTLTAATQYLDGSSQDWRDHVATFRVLDPKGTTGLARLPTRVEWRR